MNAAAFTFGSFGDIVAVLQIAFEIRRTLVEAASQEIQALLGDIDSFLNVLQNARSRLEAAQDVPPSLHHGLSHAFTSLASVAPLSTKAL